MLELEESAPSAHSEPGARVGSEAPRFDEDLPNLFDFCSRNNYLRRSDPARSELRTARTHADMKAVECNSPSGFYAKQVEMHCYYWAYCMKPAIGCDSLPCTIGSMETDGPGGYIVFTVPGAHCDQPPTWRGFTTGQFGVS